MTDRGGAVSSVRMDPATYIVMPPLTLHFRRGWSGWWEMRTEHCDSRWVPSGIRTTVEDGAKVEEMLKEEWPNFKVVRVEDAGFDA